ncbi:AarF/ABC1/UbiB kinase family protein [Candidatus Woesearchaeota archaeon]|nr:AarF/ABC1/UbiB kinase family protein [Candidatus Woesearchaeota archaeon]
MLLDIKKEVRDLNRFRHILLVLFEEGFGYLLDKIKLKRHIPFKNRIKKTKEEISPAVRLRIILEKLGPTFIKLGQLLSVRPDLIPKEYIKELEKLQDKVKAAPFNEIEKEIEKELKKPIKNLFSSFNEKPIASASISQVYEAKLKSGDKVAVKIQRPNVKNIMKTDIEIMIYIAKLIEKNMPEIRKYNPTKIVEEFADWTERELDFRIEARNAKKFYKNFQGSRTIHIPRVYDEYTTPNILVTEFIEGIELHDIEKIKKNKLDFGKIIKNGFDAILTQVFVHGFFHGDPHPGNILIMKNNVIGLVDFGIVGYFNEDLKTKSISLLYGIIEDDLDKVADTFLEMGAVGEKDIDIDRFKFEVRDTIEELQEAKIKDVKVSGVLENVLDIALKYNVRMPTDFVLFGKTIVTLEGIALEYDPNFKFVESTKPFIEKLMRERLSPKYMMGNIIENASKFKKFISELPKQTTEALKKIQSGKIKIDIEDTDVKKLALEIDKSSNRLAYGIIIAALIVAGALVMQVNQPLIFGMPVISFISFLIAFILLIMLFSSILSERRLR